MLAEIRQRWPAEVALNAGGGGVFDISVNGQLVFSKQASKRFPEPGEIAALIEIEKTE